jgi:hypothetical protein
MCLQVICALGLTETARVSFETWHGARRLHVLEWPDDTNPRAERDSREYTVSHLADIVRTSQQVAETRSRLEKIGILAACLRRLPPAEIEIGLRYLVGGLIQGRIGTITTHHW